MRANRDVQDVQDAHNTQWGWEAETPDFSVLCHYTKLLYSCSHMVLLRSPLVVHTASCTFEHVDKHKHCCHNMTGTPEILPISSLCHRCWERAERRARHSRKGTTSHAAEGASETTDTNEAKATDTKAKTNKADPLETRADTEERNSWIWELTNDTPVTRVSNVPKYQAGTATSKTATKAKNGGVSDPIRESSKSDTKSDTKSDIQTSCALEAASGEEGGLDDGRRSSIGSWVEVEHCAEWNDGGEDEGLLAQRQKDKPQRRRWLLGLV